MTEFANSFRDFDIDIPDVAKADTHGEIYCVCPICTPYRKENHQNEKKLAVNPEKGVWRCNHCGWKGGLVPLEFLKGKKIINTSPLQKCTDRIYQWFADRGISKQTVDWCGTKYSIQSVRQKDTDTFVNKVCIAFVSRQKGLIRMVKYRDNKKNFKIAPESTLIAWGLDNLRGSTEGIITEGEIDAYSYIEAGFKASTSVPNGTTITPKEKEIYQQTGKMPTDIHLNLTWLDNSYESYDHLETIYICTDDDPAGIKLRMELGRRLGYDRCRIVKYSNYTYIGKDGVRINCKDANDVLMHHGKEAVLKTLEDSQGFPIADVVTVNDVSDELDEIYSKGITKGKTTGWPHLDPHFNWLDGHLIIQNGFPNNGKTTFVFNLLLMHAKLYNGRWGYYCPENYPIKNAYATCIEIFGGNTLDLVDGRMPYDVYMNAKKFVHEHIEFVNRPDGYTAQDLRDLSLRMIKNRGINGFVIDPWNALRPSKYKYNSHDEELDGELSAEQRFAINTNTNRIILAHPPTPIRDKDKVYAAPSPFEIKGGAIWYNKAYEIICNHLRHEEGNDYTTEVHIQKVKDMKSTGLRTHKDYPVLLKFNRRSGRYIQQDGYDPFENNEIAVQPELLDLTF